jgi:hypothetical protein
MHPECVVDDPKISRRAELARALTASADRPKMFPAHIKDFDRCLLWLRDEKHSAFASDGNASYAR